MSDHYATLCVSYDATPSQLSSAFRALALKTHPDKQKHSNGDSKEQHRKQQQYAQIQQAYHVLSNAERRQQYDAALRAGGLRFGGSSSSSSGVFSVTELDLDDCSYDDATHCYSHPCRCGAVWQFDEQELIDSGIDLYTCQQCSIVCRVMFEWTPEEENGEAGVDNQQTATHTDEHSSTISQPD